MDTKISLPHTRGCYQRVVVQGYSHTLEWKSCELVEKNIQKVHIHQIVSVPSKISISTLMEEP